MYRDSWNFYKQGQLEGGFETGIQFALERLLVSPDFLFRIEQDPRDAEPGSMYPVTDTELASRLSFFLWSSLPDDELLDLVERGELRDPGVLEAQVKRMMSDSRSSGFIENFVGQWLYLRNLEWHLSRSG